MEIGKAVDKNVGSDEVVVSIVGIEEPLKAKKKFGESPSFSRNNLIASANVELPESHFSPKIRKTSANSSFSRNTLITSPNGELIEPQFSPTVRKTSADIVTTDRPTKIQEKTVIDRPLLTRSACSKPKSRLIEQLPRHSSYQKSVQESGRFLNSGSPSMSSFRTESQSPKGTSTSHIRNVRTACITTKTPASKGVKDGDKEDDEDDEDDEDVYHSEQLKVEKKPVKKWKFCILIELIVFSTLIAILLASFTVKYFRNHSLWGLETWKWLVLVLVIFCGRLFTEWFIDIFVFLIERNFLLKKKVLYFVHGLKKSVRLFVWLALVLFAWKLLIIRGAKRPKGTIKAFNYITRALVSSLIGATIWMSKTTLVKLAASTFHVKRFFDRIQDSIFHQYVLLTLSGPPMIENMETGSRTRRLLSLNYVKKGKKVEKEEVDINKLYKMEHEKISSWTIWGLIKVIQDSRLETVSNALDVSVRNNISEKTDQKITTTWEAKAAAQRIFKNVARSGHKYIDEEDLLRFMKKEDVHKVLPAFGGAMENGRIKKASLRNWVVNVYKERKLLAHSLDDTKTAIEELNQILSGIVLIVIIVVWLLLMGIATTKMLVFVSSQLFLVAFIFGNTCKNVFESLIFVFIMHPFDIGDRCVVDGVQLIVEEINILTTVFLRYDNEMIFYPNSVLATKPISNFFRSPEMVDYVKFSIDVSTSTETIEALKAKIKRYITRKPKHWFPDHSLQIKKIENVNMKMALRVHHTINFQDFTEKQTRKTELIFELKKIFEELGIRFRLLPQEDHVHVDLLNFDMLVEKVAALGLAKKERRLLRLTKMQNGQHQFW